MSPQTLEGSRWCKIAHQESESPMTLSGCMFSFIWYNCLASRLPGRWIPRGLFHPDHQYISADHNWFCVPSSPVTGLDKFVLSWTQTVTTEDIYVLARYYKGKKTLGKGGVKSCPETTHHNHHHLLCCGDSLLEMSAVIFLGMDVHLIKYDHQILVSLR